MRVSKGCVSAEPPPSISLFPPTMCLSAAPLGKLVFYWVSRLVDYDWTVCEYEGIADLYDERCKVSER